MRRIYLDYAATTPVDPEVRRAMEPYFFERFGNPGSLHSFGQEAIAALDRARETVARAMGAEFRQVIFTASATEANNLALRGALLKFSRATPHIGKQRIVVSEIEHESVLEAARAAERVGAEVVRIRVDRRGVVDIEELKKSLTPGTAFVSVMYAQNEIGAVEPVAEIAKAVREFRGNRAYPLFHTDAAQALQFLDCNANRLGADLMTISAHKIYGPKGAGALFVRDASLIAPVTAGGGQEFGLRSGTENVPAIAGFAKAAELAASARANEAKRLAGLRDRLWEGIREAVPDAGMNGGGPRLPNILNVYFPGRAAEDLLTKFDLHGLAASSGSACRARAVDPSYAVTALAAAGGADAKQAKERARCSIRFSLGRPTTEKEVEEAAAIIAAATQ